MPEGSGDPIKRLEDLLDRSIPIDSLMALRRAAGGPRIEDPAADSAVALGFDTNTLYQLTNDRSSDLVDYLTGIHVGPVVLPGQVIQEFWKNRLSAIQTQSKALRGRYDDLATEVDKLGADFAPFDERFKELLDEFAFEYGFAFDPATAGRIGKALISLEQKALVDYVPRSRFYIVAESREKTKTPPGYLDPGHGDFYVWADLLLSLLRAQADNIQFDHLVLVTDDVKPDWSRGGIPHPVLSAEVAALLGVPFDTWPYARLRKFLIAKVGSTPETDKA